MIDKETVERIKDAADIVEVVGDYVHLVRRGANYMGLCPFHNERTPSFSVNKRKNFCFCFSCKQGGSPVNFIMKKEGLSYHDALLHLANKYGIEVKERELTDEERERQSEREAMLVANEWAMQKMKNDLHNTEEGRDVGLQYLYQRGVTQEAAEAFRLGYALDRGNELTSAAKAAGYDLNILKALGLVGTSQKGNDYDRFRGRVIFPIMNSAGKVIAFGGRDLKGGLAKYINSPESELYKKSNELYGIYQARTAITNEDKCYLVEGYLDVIGMWQSGMKNVVASSGTALTDGQIALIHRFSENITLIYDGDAAGIKASLRGIDMLLNHKMKVKVLLLPDGDDPDSFARKHTPEEFREYIAEHETDIIRFKAKVLLHDIQDPQRRIEAVNSMVTSLAHIPDQVARDIYIQECSRIMNMPEETIMKAVVRVRGELIAKWKKEREYRRIDSEQSSADVQPDPPSHSGYSAIQQYTAMQPAQPTQPVPSAQKQPAQTMPQTQQRVSMSGQPMQSTLQPIERKILEYCVKYGFLEFCTVTDENENVTSMNVIEYVYDELSVDDISFSVESYERIFRLLLDMRPAYDQALKRFSENLKEEMEHRRKQGIDAIAAKDLSIAQIEREEKALQEELDQFRRDELTEFAKDFPTRELGSHEDDMIRETVTDLVLERHQLSNIYYRDNNVVETDQDRLSTLVPRALLELRGEILNHHIRDELRKLNDAVNAGDVDAERICQQRINNLIHTRSMLAKDIGDRVLSPTR